MHPDAALCTRCGYAIPLDRDRCLACGRRVRRRDTGGGVVAGPARTGPAAADAWAVWSSAIPDRSPAPELGDLTRYRDATPRAVRLVEALRLARVVFAVLGAVAAVQLGLALAADDLDDLADLEAWDALDTATSVLALLTGGVLVVVAVFGLGWAQVALANLRALALELHAPPTGRFRVVVLMAAVAVVAGAWAWNGQPLGEERTTALVTLAVATVGCALASSIRPAIAAITLVERQRAELVARIHAAGDRAAHHGHASRPRRAGSTL